MEPDFDRSDWIKTVMLDCATLNEYGRIVFDSTPPPEALELVRDGRLVRISEFVFCVPDRIPPGENHAIAN